MGKVLFFIFLMFWIRVDPAADAGRPADELRLEVPGAAGIVNILVAAIWYEMVIRPGLA